MNLLGKVYFFKLLNELFGIGGLHYCFLFVCTDVSLVHPKYNNMLGAKGTQQYRASRKFISWWKSDKTVYGRVVKQFKIAGIEVISNICWATKLLVATESA